MSRKYGNRSGQHTLPRVEVHATPEAVALWKQAAEASADAESLSDWIRSRLIVIAAEELKLDPVAALRDCE